jgi:hypothetical protein
MRHHLANIYRLGTKELWSLWRDPTMLFLIIYTFTVGVLTQSELLFLQAWRVGCRDISRFNSMPLPSVSSLLTVISLLI